MPTQIQIQLTLKALRKYRSKYLKQEFKELDESATRIMANSFLTDVLGYEELKEVKTEYQIRGEYADYVIQTDRKKRFVVEVKSIEIDLTDRHLRQSLLYAANEGVDWIILFNGRQVQLYRVLFEKPIDAVQVFSYDLSDLATLKKSAEEITFLTKRSVRKGELEPLWKRHIALSPNNLVKLLNDQEVSKYLRRSLRKETGIYFDLREVSLALQEAVTSAIEAKIKDEKRRK